MRKKYLLESIEIKIAKVILKYYYMRVTNKKSSAFVAPDLSPASKGPCGVFLNFPVIVHAPNAPPLLFASLKQ